MNSSSMGKTYKNDQYGRRYRQLKFDLAAIINRIEQPLPVDMSMFQKAWLILACFVKSLKLGDQGGTRVFMEFLE